MAVRTSTPPSSSTPNTVKPRKVMAQPWYVHSNTFAVLWVMLLLLIAAGFATLFTRVPVHATGVAIVVDGKKLTQYGHDEPLLAVFLPPETLPKLHTGQSLVFQTERNKPRQTRSVETVESELLSPDAAQKQFNLSAGTGVALSPLSAVVVARLEPPPGEAPESLVGRSVRVEVEIGTRRAGAFIPLINRFFAD